jgi:hypothetical protein
MRKEKFEYDPEVLEDYERAFCSRECLDEFYTKFGIPRSVIIKRTACTGHDLCVLGRGLLARVKLEFGSDQ